MIFICLYRVIIRDIIHLNWTCKIFSIDEFETKVTSINKIFEKYVQKSVSNLLNKKAESFDLKRPEIERVVALSSV